MNELFHNLDEEKRERIINAALKDFAKRGFKYASTDEIIKNANISKGSLFNYFGNKKNLYLYLIEYSKQIVEKIYEETDLNEPDLFKRLENIGATKVLMFQLYPQVPDFLVSIKEEDSIEVADSNMQEINQIYKEGLEVMFENIDLSKFRDDIDLTKAQEILNWVMVGFSEKVISQLSTFENIDIVKREYLKEWELYSAILKRTFYKEDYKR